jgi:hypothetical protein
MAAMPSLRKQNSRCLETLRGVALGCAVLWSSAAPCQATLPDYQIKAAFLYHFTQFIEWPSSGDDLFAICVAGDRALRGALEELTRGKLVGTQPIRVRQITDPGEAHACHVVFIGVSGDAKRQQFLAGVHDLDVLTVGEEPGFRAQGGMIELFLEDNRIRFDINEQALREAHLRASSKLLRLARRLEQAHAGGSR